jgi:hypothetical protein
MSEDTAPTPPGGPTPPDHTPASLPVAEPAIAHDPHPHSGHKHGGPDHPKHGHHGCGCSGPVFVPPHTHAVGDFSSSPKTLRTLLVALLVVSALLLFLVGMIVGAHHSRERFDDRYHSPWVTHAYNDSNDRWYGRGGAYAVPGASSESAAGAQSSVAPAETATPSASDGATARPTPERGDNAAAGGASSLGDNADGGPRGER